MINPSDLKPFILRVRLVRAWRQAGWALLATGLASVVWTLLDLMGISYVNWAVLGGGFALLLAAGAAWEMLRPLPAAHVAASLDRRAGLQDRLATAIEERPDSSLFDELQAEDARGRLSSLSPRRLFPFLVGRRHWVGAAACSLAGGAAFLMTTTLFLDEEGKEVRKKAVATAERIESVAKPLEEANSKKGRYSEERRNLAREMQKLAADLRRSRLSEEQVMQRANDMKNMAMKAMESTLEKAAESAKPLKASAVQEMLEKQSGLKPEDMKRAALDAQEQAALQQLMNQAGIQPDQQTASFSAQELKEMGMESLDPSLMNLSDEQAKALMQEVEKQLAKLDEASKSRPLTEREKQLRDLMKSLKDKLKLSEEARKALKELANTPEYKELQKMLSEMAAKMEKAKAKAKAQSQPLSQEELDELKEMAEGLQEKMDAFAKQWADPETREEMMKQIRELIEALKEGKLEAKACSACLGLLPGMLPGLPMPGGDEIFTDSDHLNTLDKPEDIEGKSQTSRVKGERDQQRGTEAYYEIKAPTLTGTRSSVPYSQALPRYKREAEKAIGRKAVPKEHEQRVKKYFESLSGGRP